MRGYRFVIALMLIGCQVDGAGRDGDQDGDVDEGTETHYVSPIEATGVDPTIGGPVARVTTSTTRMGSRGEIRGVEHVDVVAAPPPSRYHEDIASPDATYTFDTGPDSDTNIAQGGWPGDSNVAASSTHVCLTARGAFACYDKGGQLVALGAGTTAKPYKASEFFNLSGLSPPLPNVSVLPDPVKDGRVVFDPNRGRFFFVFQSREGPGNERLLIAVSKSEDPRDGFWTYGDYPNQLNPDGTPAGQDYDRIGINHDWFLVSNGMGDAGQIHFMYTAADLASGQTPTRVQWSHSLAQGAAPVAQSTSSDAYWVNRDDATHVSVWAVRNGVVYRHTAVYQLGSNTGDVPGDPRKAPQKDDGTKSPMPAIDFTNIKREPQEVDMRGNLLTWAANETHTWNPLWTANVFRLVQLDVSSYWSTGSIPVTIDHMVGGNAPGDPPGEIFDYGWPGVASNANGDLVIGSVRTDASIYPELRTSVWQAGSSAIDSDVMAGISTGSDLNGGYHMAGAAPDPTTSGVYLSQMITAPLPDGAWWYIHVWKVLGWNLPDLMTTKFTAPANVQLDVPFTVTVTVQNQGDWPMPSSQGAIYLDIGNSIIPSLDPQIGTFYTPSLSINATAVMNVTCTIPSSLGTLSGTWTIGPALDRGAAAAEQSERNNANPFLAGLHGNAHVTLP
jgi:hypothetical protein